MIDSLQLWATHTRAIVLPRGSLGARFARGAFWSLVGTVISQGLGVAASVVTARLLGKVVFGQLGMINSTIGMFGVLAGLGLGLTATKYVAEFRVKDPDRAGKILGLSQLTSLLSGGTVALLLFAFAPVLAARTLNAPHLVNELRLGCGLLFLNALNGAQTGALAGFEAFKTIAQVNLARGLLNFPVMIAGVWIFGLPGAVGAMVVVAAAGWLINHLSLRRECDRASVPVTYRGVSSELRVLGEFSFPASLSGAMVGPILWLANVILANQPGGYGELGLISAANQWRTATMMLPALLCNAALPILSAEQGKENDPAGYGKVMDVTQSLSILFAVPLSTLIMFLGHWIMGLYGPDFSDGTPVLLGVMFGITISAIGSAAGAGIIAKGMMWFGTLQNLTWGAVLLAFVWTLAPIWGAKSFALGFAVTYFVLLAWSYWVLRQDLPNGMLKRTFSAAGYLLLVTLLCLSLPPVVRAILAAPVFTVSILVSLFVFAGSDLRREISVLCARVYGTRRIVSLLSSIWRRLVNEKNHLRRRRFTCYPTSLKDSNDCFISCIELVIGKQRVGIRGNPGVDLWPLTEEIFIKNRYCPPDLPIGIGQNDVVFDVGANIGVFSIYAALRTQNKVLAFEPVPANYILLTTNVNANSLANIQVVTKAVSESHKVVEMLMFEKEMTGCRIPSPTMDRDVDSRQMIQVECVTIAEAMDAFSVDRIDFLKLDCEGEEFAILYGLEQAVLGSIGTIALEYHDNVGKGFSADLARYLASKRFQVCIRENLSRPALGYLYAWRKK